MKILNVYFKNINSLEGENRIDFDKTPLSDAGVFAITGVNGSGKSSILDAMTLALYGETFRFNKPAENVMTQHTSGCFSQVDFLVEGQRYRSSWQAKKHTSGSLEPITMRLTQLDDEAELILETEPHKVLTKIIQLTGMDFRRFTRSIILEQGDFSAFLMALDAERLDILERIISHDIYADYKQEIQIHIQQAQAALDALQSRLANIDLMSEAQYESVTLDLADQQARLAELKQEQLDLTQLQNSLQAVERLQQEITQAEQSQAQDTQNLESLNKELSQLAETDAALLFKADIQALAQHSTQIESEQQQAITLQQAAQTLSDQLHEKQLSADYLAQLQPSEGGLRQQKIRELSQTLSHEKSQMEVIFSRLNQLETQVPVKQKALLEVENWLTAHQKQHSLVDNMPEVGSLKNKRQHIINLQKKLKSFNKEHRNKSSASTKNQSDIGKIKKSIAEANKSLAQLNRELEHIANGHSLEETIALQSEQAQRLTDFIELRDLAKVYRKFVRKGFSKRFEGVNKTQLDQRLDAKYSEIDAAKNIQSILEKAVYREALKTKLTEDRQQLEDGVDCSLCGAKVHPYAHRAPEIHNSQQALADQNKILKKLQTDAKRITQEITAYTTFTDKNQQHSERINRVQTEWVSLASRLNTLNTELGIGQFRIMRSYIRHEKSTLKEIQGLVKRYRAKAKEIAKTETWIVKKENVLQKREARQTQLDTQGKDRPQEMVLLDEDLTQAVQEENLLSQHIVLQLKELEEDLPSFGKEDALYDRLSQQRQNYQSYELKQTALEKEITQITGDLEKSREQLNTIDEQVSQTAHALSQEENAALYFSSVDKQTQFSAQELKIEQLNSQLTQTTQSLLQAVNAASYQSIEQVQSLIALHETQADKIALQQQLQERITQQPKQLAQLQQQQEAEPAYQHNSESVESIHIKLREKTVQIEIIQSETSTLEQRITLQKSVLANNAQLLNEIETQTKVLTQANTAQQAMETESEIQFRQRVQSDIIQKLLTLANNFLNKMNGRYQVQRSESETGLALSVIDSKQNNSLRAIKSLSGGELFVLSLAMALSLSEIANNGRAVDSLFIDEGFGNLDADALYMVISTLENLKTQGKSIGIISHVDGVKQRIKTQLELIKNSNGTSRLALHAI